ncbi:RHS repeat-associated core domain-containing protein [Niveispirillum sp. KHB5.9]|uniref:RHS repeat-associated core domain-containing protein n=1 Tax=Niveispirillum sp. KHB5.9 TaxID=3400269 RepID=UPI003A87041C
MPVRRHSYDGAGRRLTSTIALPRPATGVTGSAPTVAMSFTYDEAGNRTGATWSGATVGWRYDGLNRVTGIDLGAEAVTRHAYDLLGRRTATMRTDIAHGGAGSTYEYDIAGQLKELKHSWSGGSLKASYGYDDAGALVSEALDNSAFLWQPAPTLSKTTNYDPASPINALTKVDGVAQVHDGRGNRTGAATRTWRYDSRNMLTGANAPGMATTYGYYPEGGRAWKQVNGVTTLYLELDGVEWGAYEANGTLKERTIRASGTGGAAVAVQASAGGLIRLLPNRQGSVIGWLRPDGKLGGAYTYDAYGNSPQAAAAGPSFRYAGMRFDAETGLYHTPNRAYDPADGRWMQLDPIGIKDGLNRYAYVKNSPVMGVDPSGLKCQPTVNGIQCTVDKFYVEDKNGKNGLREVSRSDLSPKQRDSIIRLEGNMTEAHRNLSAHPNREAKLSIPETPGVEVPVNAKQIAQLMGRRTHVFAFQDRKVDKDGKIYNIPAVIKDDTITFFNHTNAMSDRDQQITYVHENFHGNGTATDIRLARGHMGYEPFATSHQSPFDNAAIKLLGFK